MVEIRFVPVEAWHVEHVAEHMRQSDRDEVRALNDLSPREALDLSLSHRGEAWTALFDGEPAALFGVVPLSLLGGTAIGWLLGTTLLETHWRAFAKASRERIREVLTRFDVLINITHVDNTLSLRWLAWLGATFDVQGIRVRFELCA